MGNPINKGAAIALLTAWADGHKEAYLNDQNEVVFVAQSRDALSQLQKLRIWELTETASSKVSCLAKGMIR